MPFSSLPVAAKSGACRINKKHQVSSKWCPILVELQCSLSWEIFFWVVKINLVYFCSRDFCDFSGILNSWLGVTIDVSLFPLSSFTVILYAKSLGVVKCLFRGHVRENSIVTEDWIHKLRKSQYQPLSKISLVTSSPVATVVQCKTKLFLLLQQWVVQVCMLCFLV